MWVIPNAPSPGFPMPDQPPAICDFCLNLNVPLYEGGVYMPTRICGFCAALAVAQTTP